ncbi:hypothetical protein [Alkalibacterium sp. 20]|uniref:hypothetical protein n=1 Tax=Alkalibacterium sp. 20 TaxID=1798803 RepID=UPI000AA73323|nr:hypothetical protein [Alkalibacterium sp. 20]
MRLTSRPFSLYLYKGDLTVELETKGSALKKERMPKSEVNKAIREQVGTVVLETNGMIAG